MTLLTSLALPRILLLAESGFDRFLESIGKAHCNEGGRPSIPPGIYFQRLLVG